MIRVVVFDAHPAARAGLERIVTEAPGVALAGAVGGVALLGGLALRRRR